MIAVNKLPSVDEESACLIVFLKPETPAVAVYQWASGREFFDCCNPYRLIM